MKLPRRLTLGLGLVLLAAAALPARAGPPPIGAWVSARGARLLVTDHATCAFVVPDRTAEGECTWTASASGGILKIQYTMTPPTGAPRTQVLYLDVRWVDQVTITVTGEAFRRTQW